MMFRFLFWKDCCICGVVKRKKELERYYFFHGWGHHDMPGHTAYYCTKCFKKRFNVRKCNDCGQGWVKVKEEE